MGRRKDRKQTGAKALAEIVFDGARITATTRETSAAISIEGRSVSATDVGKVVVIRGGVNFLIGPYLIASVDVDSMQWTLDRTCTTGAGYSMIGQVFNQPAKRHKSVKQYFDPSSPNNPGVGEARQHVLEVLNLIEPRVLTSLAEIWLRGSILGSTATGNDLSVPLHHLCWGHVEDAGRFDTCVGLLYPELIPLRTALVRWANDDPLHRWNLCDSVGVLIEWIAEAAVQTLVYWQQRGRIPKTLKWEGLDFHRYRSLDSVEARDMFVLERHFDAGSGYARIAPEDGPPDSPRLPDRVQREAKQEYKSLGEKLGLARMLMVSRRYFEWYAKRTFLELRLREIREWELVRSRDKGLAAQMGIPWTLKTSPASITASTW